MAQDFPRGIVVLDIGSTNTRATLFDRELGVLASRSTRSFRADDPYLCIDATPVLEFARNAIAEFDRTLPIDTIVPCAHGSALALLDAYGSLALPIMAYEADPPRQMRRRYAALEPPFGEVFAPTNPGALTLGLQLLWQESAFPAEFDRVRTIMPLGQYVAYLLCGVPSSEVTAIGAQTHLWNPVARDYSNLAKERGWAELFAPLRMAFDRLGTVTALMLRGRGEVLTGIHDSNANLLRYLGGEPMCLASTGTWMIAFDSAVPISRLRPEFDQVCNTNVFGEPVSCCRFMAGREFEAVSSGEYPALASLVQVEGIIGSDIFAAPSFTDSGGPMPQTGGKGTITGELPAKPGIQASLASLYCAQMTATALDRLGTSGRVIVDGPFAENPVYLAILAALLDRCELLSSQESNGTSRGAALLALMDRPDLPSRSADLKPVDPARIDGLGDYHTRWLAAAG